MRYLFSILISLISVTSTAASDRVYSTGCIPTRNEHRIPIVTTLSSGATSPLPLKMDIEMTSVKHQKNVSACAVFALIACCEYLYPGKRFSEAELYIRLKTRDSSDRNEAGVKLSEYCLEGLLEGLVEDQYFIPYHFYDTYVVTREKMIILRAAGKLQHNPTHRIWWSDPRNRNPVYGDSATHTMSPNYAESIQEFKDWAVMNSANLGEIPAIVKPCWRVEKCWANSSGAMTGELDRSTNVIMAPELVNNLRRTVVAPAIVLPASREYLGNDAYFRGVSCLGVDSTNINALKSILAKPLPVVVGVETFAKYELVPVADGKTEKKLICDFWRDEIHLETINYHLDMKEHLPAGVETDGGHAICLCGYDDAKAAFRFKNSWGTNWGDKGYAWISYDYIKNHSEKYGATYVTKN